LHEVAPESLEPLDPGADLRPLTNSATSGIRHAPSSVNSDAKRRSRGTDEHCQARLTFIDVQVAAGDGVPRAYVRDDGRGGAALTRGPGLVGLEDRLEALGGHISLHRPPGGGTTVEIALPVDDPSNATTQPL
jgi:signal transduction histidine kinase